MAEKTVLFFLARHGTTTLNASNCFRGALNPSLDEQGFRDAHRLAFYFRPIEVSMIFCSDKLRATQTAKIIAAAKNVKFVENEGLRAFNVGDFSGKERTPENVAKLQYYINNPDVQIPGGESLHDFQARIQPLFEGAIDIAMDYGLPVLVVGHSSLIHELGQAFNDGNHESTLVKPGGVAALFVDVDGALKAEPVFKPDLARIKSTTQRAEVVT